MNVGRGEHQVKTSKRTEATAGSYAIPQADRADGSHRLGAVGVVGPRLRHTFAMGRTFHEQLPGQNEASILKYARGGEEAVRTVIGDRRHRGGPGLAREIEP